MVCILFYRGLGGLFAALSVLPGVLLLHLVALLLQHASFEVNGHLWSVGLSLFLGGLGTAFVVHYVYYSEENRVFIHHTQVPAVDIPDNGDEETQVYPSYAPSTALPTIPLNTGGLWQMLSQPVGNHHICFLAPNQVAAAYMIFGLLLVLGDFLNFMLAPVGGLFGTIFWLFLLVVAYFFRVMACSEPLVVSSNNNYNDTTGYEDPPSNEEDEDEDTVGEETKTNGDGIMKEDQFSFPLEPTT